MCNGGELSPQHYLAAGYRNCLAGFIFLFNYIEEGAGNILEPAASFHGNNRFVMLPDIIDTFGTGDLISLEVLNEEPLLRVRPQRAVKEVAGAAG
ncbi:hypothetical protein ES705_22215 [subsurface metagenome]